MRKIVGIAALASLLALPAGAYAQGTIGGAEQGSRAGAVAGGPVGAVVGGAVGAATGTVGAVLGLDQRPRFHEYVVREHRSSFTYPHEVRVGGVLPATGVAYYAVPSEYGVPESYRYTIVNDQTVIVDPVTHRIVQVIE